MKLLFAMVAACLLTACGGSSDEGSAPPPPPPPPPPPLAPQGLVSLASAAVLFEVDTNGISGDSSGDGGVGGGAGDGAPLAGATVILTDADGKTVTGRTDSKGSYLVRFATANYKVPFIMKVVDASGNVLASINELTVTPGFAARANINPLTDKVVSDVLPASVGGTDKIVAGSALNLAGLTQAKANLLASVQAALVTAGVADTSQFDPVRSVYKYNGTGVDAVIESISHVRDPASGVTQLRAKLASLVTNADGTVVPTLITAATPLVTTQVALPSNPALTFTKITAWVARFNECLALAPGVVTANCSDAAFEKMVSTTYKHGSRDFDEDLRNLFSNTDRSHVQGSSLNNPNILFLSRSAAATVDDTAVVEITIRQPRTGPLTTNLDAPVEYTKILVFRRDDVTSGLVATNWILTGNQRSYDWSIDPRYFSTFQQTPARNINAAGGDPSFMKTGFAFNFNSRVFDLATRTFVTAPIRAVRFTGPGLPAAGVVMAPQAGNTATFTIFSKDGSLPAVGSFSPNVQTDFRLQGVVLPSREPIVQAAWPNNAAHAASPTTDISAVGAYSAYAAEIFLNDGQRVTETGRILSPLQSAAIMAATPLHDLLPSVPLLSTTRPASSTVIASWIRTPGAARIDNAFALVTAGGVTASRGASLADALAVNPTSTSVEIFNGTAGFPAGAVSEVGLSGRAARAVFVHSIRR